MAENIRFYSELKQLNEDLINLLKETQEVSPYFDFTPTLNDYIKQLDGLNKQNQIFTTINTGIFGQISNNEPNIDAGDDEAQPPEPRIERYEEPDAKFSIKCKLYEKSRTSEGEIHMVLLGLGQLYIKAMDTADKLQVIFRQEPDLKRVLMNEVLTPHLPVKPLPKAVQLAFAKPGECKFFIAKLGDEQGTKTLIENLKLG